MRPTTLHSHLMSDFFPLTFTHCSIFTSKFIFHFIYVFIIIHHTSSNPPLLPTLSSFTLMVIHSPIFTLKLLLLYIYFYHLFHFVLPYLWTYESSRLLCHFHLPTTLLLWGILFIYIYLLSF